MARQDPIPYFGTKAAYPEPPKGNHAKVLSPKGYHLIHVSLIARHGTRNPTSTGLSRMRQLESFLSSIRPDLPWLETWSKVLNEYAQAQGDLTKKGISEMTAIGNRFYKRYSDLFENQGSKTIVRSSSVRRAVESANAFLNGYKQSATSSGNGHDIPIARILGKYEDKVVRYVERNHQYCDYSVQFKAAFLEVLSSGKAPRAIQISRRMSRALGVPHMRPEFVRVVAESAAFDVAQGRANTSPFLKLLRHDDSPFLEAIDRSYRPYIRNFAQFRTIAAPLIRDLVKTLSLAAKGRGTSADLKFAHSQTLVPFLILLNVDGNGLDNRDYIPGLVGMCPFAANLTAELFKKSDINGVGTVKDYVVRLRLQERYISKIGALGDDGRDGIVGLDKLLNFFDTILREEERQGKVEQDKSILFDSLKSTSKHGLRKSPSLPTALVIPPTVQGVVSMSVPASGIEQSVFE